MQYSLSTEINAVADAAYPPHTRVKWSATAGKVTVAGNEACIGTLKNRTYRDGSECVVLDIRGPGSRIFIANGAIAAGDDFTSAASGRVVTGTAGNEDYGKALSAASAAGGLFEGTPRV
ncbi:hypothetical protein [Lacipirellula limnantheis]|uniref:DUF2190 family protein n=1 Tax=Lacipirellula limnantheis TaxID=2528024 RepID=A0A517U537_9BACT|nr:hypothetical protein [Lacipirellula limnantheis]QDT75755.1 hypothetical protein I41_49970 [Lacipirellula limnantheis]